MFYLLTFSGMCAAAYGAVLTHLPPSLPRSSVKGASVGLLALAGVYANAPLLLILALLLGTCGDVLLAEPRGARFLAGLGAFLLGHLAYAVLYAQIGGGFEILINQPWRMGAVACLILASLWVMQRLRPHLGPMLGPVMAYAGVSIVMGAAALTLPLGSGFGLAMAGSALFILSDAILGFELFQPPASIRLRRFMATLLWSLYWAGQALMFTGVLTAG